MAQMETMEISAAGDWLNNTLSCWLWESKMKGKGRVWGGGILSEEKKKKNTKGVFLYDI